MPARRGIHRRRVAGIIGRGLRNYQSEAGKLREMPAGFLGAGSRTQVRVNYRVPNVDLGRPDEIGKLSKGR